MQPISSNRVSERSANGVNVAEYVRNMALDPVQILPGDWQLDVTKFWMRWGHLIKDHLMTLCVRVSDYRASGLTIEELRRIFGGINAGELQNPVRFPSDLFGQLTAGAGSVIKRKKTIAQNAADRQADAEAKAEAVGAEAIASILAGIGDGGGFHNT